MKKTLICFLGSLWLTTSFAQLHFSDRATEWGIDHNYISPRLGGGVSCYDFDNDGWDDLTLATSDGESIHFYKNMGGSFQRLPDLVPTQEEAKQILWVDFDNDGDQDLFVASFNGLNRLYEQIGPLEFEDITLASGLPGYYSDTYGACFGDYDRDGWLDLYYGLRLTVQEGGAQHLLFHNNGDGTFTNTTAETQATDHGGRQFCSSFLDYNNDHWPDIYTAHDRYNNPNTLLENQGNGTFSNQGPATGSDIAIDAMSVTMGDYNNDGFFDIYCTNTSEGSYLLRNEGPNENGQYSFVNTAPEAGVGFYGTGWSASYLDADNDCDLDLYISGSAAGSQFISAAFYTNENDGTFSQPMAGFAGDTTRTYNNAVGDFDNDGYPDIAVISIYPDLTKVWSAETGNNHWIKLQLQGVESNRNGVGSRIECYTNDHYQQRYTQCGTGFMGQHSGTEIIGLGDANQLDSLVVTWPSGQVDRYYQLEAQQRYLLLEGGPVIDAPPLATDRDAELLTSLHNPPPNVQVHLYPSPANQVLTIEQEEFHFSHYQIINTAGQLIITGDIKANLQMVSVAQLPTGSYQLHLSSPTHQQKIISWIKH